MTTKIRVSPTVVAVSCLGLLVVIGAFLPPRLSAPSPRGASAGPQGQDVVRLTGKVWDLPADFPDMQTEPSDGFGTYTGLVAQTLGPDGVPVFDGPGHKVLTPATDAAGNGIASFLANRGGGVTDFDIVDGQVIVNEEFEAIVSVLGVDIGNTPITFRVSGDSANYEPFGPYGSPLGGNINDDLASGTSSSGGHNPRSFLLPAIFPAGTAINVWGQSWKQSGGNWVTRLKAESIVNSQQVIVLRDGDPVPDIDPYGDQQALAEYIADYVDTTTNTIDLEPYQVIYVYELYTTDLNDSAADFQDMVVLLGLARPESLIDEPALVSNCGPDDDNLPVLSSEPSMGGISSASSFAQWFRDTLGVSRSGHTSIDLYGQPDGTYLFDDQTDPKYSALGGFYPADGRPFSDGVGHNDYFTTRFEAFFTYDAFADQFLEVTSSGDVWVFIDDQLVIDLGGVHSAMAQRIDLARLCLNDGETHKLTVFRAHRYAGESRFRVWTNLPLEAASLPSVIGQFD